MFLSRPEKNSVEVPEMAEKKTSSGHGVVNKNEPFWLTFS